MIEPTPLGQSGATDLTVPISYCIVCDAGRKALEVPDEPCDHSYDKHATFMLPVQPVDKNARLPGDA